MVNYRCQTQRRNTQITAEIMQTYLTAWSNGSSFLLITQYEMPFINKSEVTKRSKDRKIYGKCTNGTNRRSRVWPVCFIYISASSWTGFSCLTFSNLELKAWWTAFLNEREKLSSSFGDMLSWSVTICLALKLFDVANQGHCYIDNSLQTWEYPIGDPVQFLNWFLAWKWGCVLLWPEVIFFSSALQVY